MDALSFLDFAVDFQSPRTVNAYDELPLWSAMFGLLLLDEVPLAGVGRALDVGCGTGFPLIELAERLGPAAEVHGIDPWAPALERARDKIAARRTPNALVHEGSAASMPFDDASFDLVVSNLGVNNFDDRAGALRECRRVLRDGGTLALTTNLQGHMRELYAAFEAVLSDDARRRLREHVEHRATIGSLHALLGEAGFTVTRVVEREAVMRFGNGEALFEHYFIKLGFLPAWKEFADRDAFARVMAAMRGEVRLTVPMAYVEAR